MSHVVVSEPQEVYQAPRRWKNKPRGTSTQDSVTASFSPPFFCSVFLLTFLLSFSHFFLFFLRRAAVGDQISHQSIACGSYQLRPSVGMFAYLCRRYLVGALIRRIASLPFSNIQRSQKAESQGRERNCNHPQVLPNGMLIV